MLSASLRVRRVWSCWTAAAVGSEGRLGTNEWMRDYTAAGWKAAVSRVGNHVTPRASDG